jgi:surface carbohydrate biosynthesis protein (TIGR04326 family)
MIANGLEPSATVNVEALRFLSLTSTTATTSKNRTDAVPNQRILVLGEYDALMSAKQLQILEELVPLARDNYAFTFRPHPASPIMQGALPTKVSLSEAHTVGDDLAKCDVVLCSNVSSASLDASLIGIPILMFRDGRGFNGSPLIAGPSVTYVNDGAEIIAALRELELSAEPRSLETVYPMYLDSDLSRWRVLLDSLIKHENK